MATYYVRNDGNDNNVGTSSGTAGAWKTLTKALGSSGISGGDTLYIAPGVYRETVTFGFASSGSTTYIYGDPKALQFAGVTPAIVRITSNTLYDSLSTYFTPSSDTLISGTGKSNITMESMYLEYTYAGLAISSCSNIQLRNSVLTSHKFTWSDTFAISITQDTTLLPHRFENLISMGGTFTRYIPITSGVGISGFMNVKNCLAIGYRYYNSDTVHTLNSPITFNNCTFICSQDWALHTYGIGVGMIDVYNTFVWSNQYANVIWNGGNHINYTNCRFSGVPQHHNTQPNKLVNCSYGLPGLDFAEQLLFGLSHTQFLSSKNNGYLVGAGTTAGAGTSDLFGYSWQQAASDIGAIQYRSLNSITNFAAPDRQFESITISPDSTSQSLYMMLGATGVSYNVAGLVAHYTRDNAAPVSITLAAQTVNGAWTSGGFAEVSSSNAPGLYRLDVPNAAFSSGVGKVIVSVRGGGVNGAFHNVLLQYTRTPDVEKRTFVSGNTSTVEYINITQGNSGSALTGLAYNSSGLTAYYVRPGASPTAISLATQTATGSYSSGGFVPVDNTNMPGLYRIDIPNAVFNSGVDEATIYIRGAANMNPLRIEYR
jgi:hypothetical protein